MLGGDMFPYNPISPFIWIWTKLFGKKIKVQQLPPKVIAHEAAIQLGDASHIIPAKYSDNQMPQDNINERLTLKTILLKSGKDVYDKRLQELEDKRQELINGKDLLIYFENIWKTLILKLEKDPDDDSIIIAPHEIECKEELYKTVVELFKTACADAGFDISKTQIKARNYYFFSPNKTIKAALQSIKGNNEDIPQLTQGGPYR